MGNFNLKTCILRCDICYSLRKMTINPGYPDVNVCLECRCDNAQVTIKNMISELKKGTPYKIICDTCKKEEKNSYYCNDCNHIYCNKCMIEHKKHRYISIAKVDFYCIYHQKELFSSYCHDCMMNFCKKCKEEKRHLNHNCCEFNKLTMNKNDRNYLKEKFKLAESKLEYTSQFVKRFQKKLNKEEEKNLLVNAEKKNLKTNKKILELINFFMYYYDNSKLKNYNIIYNFKENINLNVNKFKFTGNNLSLEEAFNQILNYLNDYIIFRSEKGGSNIYRQDSLKSDYSWGMSDYSDIDIGHKQTIVAPRNLDLNLNDNYDNNYTYRKNKNEKQVKLFNSINTNYDINNVNNSDYCRPRSHATFAPTKED